MAIIAESLPTQSAAARNEVQQQIDAQRARTIRAAYTTRFAAAELQRQMEVGDADATPAIFCYRVHAPALLCVVLRDAPRPAADMPASATTYGTRPWSVAVHHQPRESGAAVYVGNRAASDVNNVCNNRRRTGRRPGPRRT